MSNSTKPRLKLSELHSLKKILRQYRLHTVCEDARCPNISDCFHRKRATFLILGTVCTRACKFCNIGNNTAKLKTPDPKEPMHIAQVVQALDLKHAVITSVTRDDLEDQGATHFAKTILAIKQLAPKTTIEVLTPDFSGDKKLIDIVLQAKPDIFNHNLETTETLTPIIRSKAEYWQSLSVLDYVAKQGIITKSGIMVGLGENLEDIQKTLKDMTKAGVKIVTIGQYYPPSKQHFPLKKLYTNAEFKEIETIAKNSGIPHYFCGANVRSSYMAEETFKQLAIS